MDDSTAQDKDEDLGIPGASLVVERHLALIIALETVKFGQGFLRKEVLSSAIKKGRIS